MNNLSTFSDKFIATMKLRYNVIVSDNNKKISYTTNGNTIRLERHPMYGDLECTVPEIGFTHGVNNFEKNAKSFTNLQKFWEFAVLMDEVEDIYGKQGA